MEAKIENVDKVTEFVNEVLEEKDCPLKVQMQLDVAIDEIFGNIAYYAYGKGSGNATIQIEMEDNPPKITLIFIDQGTPYNPLENKDPDITLDIEDREIGGLAASRANIEDAKSFMKFQTIGHDKLNQLRHVRFFKDMPGMYEHMRKHAAILRPKFEKVEDVLEKEIGGLGIFLVKKTMDELSYEYVDGQNILTMKKELA